jgi:uncharacterized protein YndB with AHSA1/START domain
MPTPKDAAPLVFAPDPKLDLVFERNAEVSCDQIWAAWTQPELLCNWFCPSPWRVSECEIDLRPGGIFRTVMESPDGARFPNLGSYLEVVPRKRLVWTNALAPGFRPTLTTKGASVDFVFTAIITIEAQAATTKYRAHLLHSDEEGCQKHAEMGFQEGWGMAFDQLVALMRAIPTGSN